MKPLSAGNTVNEMASGLRALKLAGMAEALESMEQSAPEFAQWTWQDRLAWLIRAQNDRRFSNKVAACLKAARLRYPMAALTDILAPEERGLDLAWFSSRAQDDWLKHHDNVVLLGASGSGKTYLACAIGAAVCNLGLSVRYVRMADLLQELAEARISGMYDKSIERFTKPRLLILDEFLLTKLVAGQTADLLNLVERRYTDSSLLICTQYPVDEWIDRLCVTNDNQPLCEAILDRIIHTADLVAIGGEISMRERLASR